MVSKIKVFLSSPSDLIVIYIFSLFHFLFYDHSWRTRKLFLIIAFATAVLWQIILLIKAHRKPDFKPDSFLIIALLFFLLTFVSMLLSDFRFKALDYLENTEGVIIWGVYLSIFLLLRKCYIPQKSHFYLLLISGYVECFLVIINSCVYNLFGHPANSSTFASYNTLGLVMPIYYVINAAMLLEENDRTQIAIHYLLAFFFSIGLIFSRSDNTLLCMLSFLSFLPFVYSISGDHLKRLFNLLSLLFLAMCSVNLLSKLSTYRTDITLTSILLKLSIKIPSYISALCCATVFAWQSTIRTGPELHRFNRILRFCVLAALSCVFIFLLLENFAGLRFGYRIDQILLITDSWGTGRGRLWRACTTAFRDYFTPVQKVIGIGLNSIDSFVFSCDPQLTTKIKPGYCLAHNFILQWLLEGGILGLAGYCTFCFLSIRKAFISKTSAGKAALLAVAVYLSGMLVTVSSPEVTPIFIVLLAVCAGEKREWKT